jgi:hypothetical protein
VRSRVQQSQAAIATASDEMQLAQSKATMQARLHPRNPNPSYPEGFGTPHGSRELSSELVVWYYPPGRPCQRENNRKGFATRPMRLIEYWIGRLFGLFLLHPFVSVACVVLFALGLVLADRLLFPATGSLSAWELACKEFLGLFLHVPIAIALGGAFVLGTGLVVGRLLFPVSSHLLDLLVFLFGSIFWGALLGFVVCQFARHRSARWVGAIGLLYLIVESAWFISLHWNSPYYRARGGPFRYEFEQLFTANRTDSGWEQLFVTMPVMCCIGYSLGAWLALKMGNEADSGEKAPAVASASETSKLP